MHDVDIGAELEALNRKMLAQLAVVDPGSFTSVVGAAKN